MTTPDSSPILSKAPIYPVTFIQCLECRLSKTLQKIMVLYHLPPAATEALNDLVNLVSMRGWNTTTDQSGIENAVRVVTWKIDLLDTLCREYIRDNWDDLVNMRKDLPEVAFHDSGWISE
ncbi:MAG: hypothetical protein JW726_19175 [Anaerolineales bacterium]|nr:hypothetical protein [Anaerolineales bacterium]